MRELQRNQDRALANLESVPGGFQALSSLYSQLEPLHGPREEGNPSTDALNEQFARRLGVGSTTADAPNTAALPNPWASPSQNSALPSAGASRPLDGRQLQSLLHISNTTNSTTSTINTQADANSALTERFSRQLERLHELGFTDDTRNIQALVCLQPVGILTPGIANDGR